MATNGMDLGSSTRDYGTSARSSSITYKSPELAQKSLITLNNLRQNDALCDVTLIVNGVRISAHRIWLASCSPYFQAMFTNQMAESRQQEIQMIDIDEETLQTLIDYCYCGEITITEHNVQQILPSACLLSIQEVQDFCCEFLKKQLDSTNCLLFDSKIQTEIVYCHISFQRLNRNDTLIFERCALNIIRFAQIFHN